MRTHGIGLGLAMVSVVIWVLMFLAGTDIWHDAGRPALWNRTGPPYNDLRAFVVAFYLLLLILLAQFVVAVVSFSRSRSVSS